MYLEELLEVRISRQFNIRSVEVLALHLGNWKLTEALHPVGVARYRT